MSGRLVGEVLRYAPADLPERWAYHVTTRHAVERLILMGVKLMRAIMDGADKPEGRDYFVLVVMAYNASHADRICRASMAQLERQTRLSSASLRSALSNLTRAGWIETTTTPRRGVPQQYRLVIEVN